MTVPPFDHLRLGRLEDVVLVEVMTKDLRGPELALELSAELNRVVTAPNAGEHFLLDFGHTSYLSSTGFAVIVKVVNQIKTSGRQVKICSMDPDVRIGAEIIGLDRIVELYDDRDSALDAFSRS